MYAATRLYLKRLKKKKNFTHTSYLPISTWAVCWLWGSTAESGGQSRGNHSFSRARSGKTAAHYAIPPCSFRVALHGGHVCSTAHSCFAGGLCSRLPCCWEKAHVCISVCLKACAPQHPERRITLRSLPGMSGRYVELLSKLLADD